MARAVIASACDASRTGLNHFGKCSSLKECVWVAKSQIPLGYSDRTVCILGLGFVGLTLAAIMAEVGFHIIGVEIRKDVVAKIRAGLAHFYEPGLTDALRRAVKNGRLEVHNTIPSNCGAAVYIITVGTPVGAEGRVNLDSVIRIAREIADRMNDGDMIVLRSTVKIGTTERLIRPILAKSGKRFQIAFCPERTIEGQALAELRYLPQIIGAADHDTVTRAAQLFNFITPTACPTRKLLSLLN